MVEAICKQSKFIQILQNKSTLQPLKQPTSCSQGLFCRVGGELQNLLRTNAGACSKIANPWAPAEESLPLGIGVDLGIHIMTTPSQGV